MATLDTIPDGGRVKVLSVSGGERGNSDEVRIRLLDMGLTPGTFVVAVRRAPGGDPLEIYLRGYYLSLRAVYARRVTVVTA